MPSARRGAQDDDVADEEDQVTVVMPGESGADHEVAGQGRRDEEAGPLPPAVLTVPASKACQMSRSTRTAATACCHMISDLGLAWAANPMTTSRELTTWSASAPGSWPSSSQAPAQAADRHDREPASSAPAQPAEGAEEREDRGRSRLGELLVAQHCHADGRDRDEPPARSHEHRDRPEQREDERGVERREAQRRRDHGHAKRGPARQAELLTGQEVGHEERRRRGHDMEQEGEDDLVGREGHRVQRPAQRTVGERDLGPPAVAQVEGPGETEPPARIEPQARDETPDRGVEEGDQDTDRRDRRDRRGSRGPSPGFECHRVHDGRAGHRSIIATSERQVS